MSTHVITHGCRSNLAEQETLAKLAPDNVTVINSCAVTARAVKDARAAARLARKRGEEVYVTGCAVAVAAGRFADLGVKIVPNREKLSPRAWGRPGERAVASSRMSRGFLAIQDGCDHHCTFCVTRIARGPSHSTPANEIVGRAQQLVDEGVKEIVLTGIDATSYGLDLGEGLTLGGLVQRLLREVEGLGRLRMSSLDAAEIEPPLLEAFADPRLMPHVHLSLQSGDNLVLKRMRRRHAREDAIHIVEKLKRVRPDIAVGADLIAGFPTETEEAHRASCALLEDCDVVYAHVFPYSPRPGTPAARMPQVPQPVRKERAAELRALASARQAAYLARFVGRTVEVASEGKVGLSEHGARVHFATARQRGALADVEVQRASGGELFE